MKIKVTLVTTILMLAVLFAGCSGLNGEFNLSQTELTLKVGDTQRIIATTDSGKQVSNIIWTSNNKSVATVSGTGKIEAVSEGNAVITATNKKGIKKECEIKVEEVEVEKIVLSSKSRKIKVGENFNLSAYIYPENATNQELKWVSDNESVAIVNTAGVVTGKSAGTINITCYSANGKEASCTVTVNKKKSSTTKQNNSNSVQTTKATQAVDDGNDGPCGYTSFYGIWCAAFKSEDQAYDYAETLRDKGFENASVIMTSQWSNMNSDTWYAVTADFYETKSAANKDLNKAKSISSNAYIKYSGNWVG